jgi:anthranilate synthase component 2
MNKSILIVDNYDSFTYNLVQLIEQAGGTTTVIKHNEIILSEIENYTNIVLSPGPGLPNETENLIEIIQRYYKEKSILGVCLGHQSIAIAFGGELYNLEKPLHGKETSVSIIDENEYLFENMGKVFKAGLYHSWAVNKTKLPDCLKVTSVNENGIIMSISHKEYDVKGIQFHPESYITKDGIIIMRNWINNDGSDIIYC